MPPCKLMRRLFCATVTMRARKGVALEDGYGVHCITLRLIGVRLCLLSVHTESAETSPNQSRPLWSGLLSKSEHHCPPTSKWKPLVASIPIPEGSYKRFLAGGSGTEALWKTTAHCSKPPVKGFHKSPRKEGHKSYAISMFQL